MAIYDINGNILTDDAKIQSYYENEMTDTIAKVKNVCTEPSLVIPVVTDIHRYVAEVQTFDDMIQNMKRFSKGVKCDFIINTGDTIQGDQSQATSLGYAFDCTESFHSIGVPYLYAQGNHDNNPYTAEGSFSNLDFSIKQVFSGFFTNTKEVTCNFSENGTDYFIDFPIGVRVIVLNSCNVKKAHNYAYGDSTANWLSGTALDMNRTIFLFSHLSSIASQVWNNNHGTNADAVKNALTAFVNNGGKLVQVSGHSHVDIAFIKPWLSVMNVCQKFSNPDIHTTEMEKITGYIDELIAPTRVADTYTADAWTVCILKPNSYELDCIRFGAGNDRYFHYNPIAPTTLTSRLTGVTWSSSDTSIATVSNGVVTGVASGTCGILAKDTEGNYEAWTIRVS